MAEQDEKTEEPTARRKLEARRKGQVAKSMDLNSAVMLLMAALALWLLGGYIGGWLQGAMKESFLSISTLDLSPNNTVYFARAAGKLIFFMLGPLFLIFLVLAIVINLLQVGFLLTGYPLKPQFAKIFNIVNGLKKLFSPEKIVDLLKNLVKMIIVGIVAFTVIKGHYKEYLYLADQSLGQIVQLLFSVLLELVIKCALLLLVLGILDFFYQQYKTKKSLKMTKQEVKDEMKQMEGDPKIKAKIRSIRMEMHRKAMMQEVPKATVVVTNPSFIAIAIRYKQGEDTAPVVVAKGKRLMAEKIKEIAREHDIPIVEDKPLARSLYEVVEVGQSIPPEFFGPVAEILAYVYNLKPEGAASAVS